MEPITVARVAVAAATYSIDKPYDYLVPEHLLERARVGVRVIVPFGRGNRTSEGVILGIDHEKRREELKVLTSVLDDESVLGSTQIKLALWLRERYFCTLYDAVKTLLPAGLLYRIRELYTLSVDRETALESGKNERECRVLETIVAHGGSAELDTIRLACGDDVSTVLRSLCADGILSVQTNAKQRVGDKTVKRVSLAVSGEEAMALVEPKKRSAPLRYEVMRLLSAVGSALSTDICYFTGASMQTLRGLEKSGLVTIETEEAFRVPKIETEEAESIQLSDEQKNVFDAIIGEMEAGQPSCTLLYGVTGSGKTAVYIELLKEVVRRGKRGMILVPEIALTPQIMAKFSAHFGDKVVMLHSGLHLTERYDQWKRIRRGEVDVVLGTRSAVFAPLDEIGMIIMDEEHEDSYQSENSPRYHARDVAKFLCTHHCATLILGSATPSVETTWQAQRGNYKKAMLKTRYNRQPLPRVLIADMRDEVRAGNAGSISEPLRREIAENLHRGEQSILFLNRRGNSRMILCGECGAVPECPRCSVPLTYHSANGRLMCHYCGHSERASDTCDECGGIIKHIGTGTQKVEEELSELFPGVQVLRMDADTVSGNHEKLLHEFEKKQIPILLGTQMVAKGLDFQNVTLVGVLLADTGLYMDNYRAAERTFSLLTQVVGRAGRGSKDGRAVIQTFTPDNDVITSAANQDYNSFYTGEIKIRRARRYPPFADVFTLTVSGAEEGAVLRAAAQLKEGMRQALSYPNAANLQTELLGPAPAPILKVNNRYRYRIFWVGRNDHATREILSYYIRAFHQKKENRGMNLYVDCNTNY